MPPGAVGFFSTRLGGVSSGDWAELNLAAHVDDDPAAVAANRRRLAETLAAPITFVRQVHGREVHLVTEPAAADADEVTADAIVVTLPEAPIAVLTADCVPVLIADPAAGVAAAVHAGRPGLVAGVLQAAIEEMTAAGATAEAMTAVVGPAVCGRCYEVPAAMRDGVDAVVPGSAATTRSGTPSLDLPAATDLVLRGVGVHDIRRTPICTMEDVRFYSYRRDGRTGRFAAVVALRP